MLSIIDFDLTILRTRKLDEKVAKAFGISFDKYRSLILEVFESNTKNYNADVFLALLEKKGIIDEHKHKEIRIYIKKLLRNVNDYIFEETEELINILKEKGKVILLTCGDKDWQNRKIENLKFKDEFDEIIISPSSEGKAPIMEQFKAEDELIYINDNAKELIKAKEILPQAKIFLVKSEYSKNADYSGIKEYTHAELIERIKVL